MSQLIGTGQNQVPVNGLLGTMAFQNKEAINVGTVIYSGLFTGGTGIINIGSGQIYKDASGRVLIGTTTSFSSPAKLQVQDNISLETNGTGGKLEFFKYGVSTGFVDTPATSGQLDLNATSILSLSTNSTVRQTLDASGNVGIGTASPSQLLDVRGNSGSDISAIIKNDGAGRAVVKLDAGGSSQSGVYFLQGGTEKWRVVATGSTSFQLYDVTAAAYRLSVNNAGNLGVGVTPSAWGSNYKAIQLPGGTVDSYTSNSISVICNAYDSGAGAWTYVTSSFATRYDQNASGQHSWWSAASGTAGAAITFVNSMLLSATSNLTVAGTISPQQATTAAAPAYVKGAMYFDTTLNKLRIGGATAWETVTSV